MVTNSSPFLALCLVLAAQTVQSLPPTIIPPTSLRRGCEHEGSWVSEGAVVKEGPCGSCVCYQGEVICSPQPTCPNCPNPVYVEHECCPLCPPFSTTPPLPTSCARDGKTYQDYEQVPTGDPCAFCMCWNGQEICAYMSCMYCENAVHVEGQCCPMCIPPTSPFPTFCERDGKAYQNGEQIQTGDPCAQCWCQEGIEQCVYADCMYCENAVFVPGQCCPSCPPPTTCDINGVTYQHGQSVPMEEPCIFCQCWEGGLGCVDAACPYCENPVYVEGQCCPDCVTSCVENGRTYQHGEVIDTGFPCESCTCQYGVKQCDLLLGDCVFCDNPVFVPGQCCPVCPAECSVEGVSYGDGELVVTADPCQACYCRDGQLDCLTQPCPKPACKKPKAVAGSCCPVCPAKGKK